MNVKTAEEIIKLKDLKSGLFIYNNELIFKTSLLRNTPICYKVSNGDAFDGGMNLNDLNEVYVIPVYITK